MEMRLPDLRSTKAGRLRGRLTINARRIIKEPDYQARGRPQVRRTSISRATFQYMSERTGRANGGTYISELILPSWC